VQGVVKLQNTLQPRIDGEKNAKVPQLMRGEEQIETEGRALLGFKKPFRETAGPEKEPDAIGQKHAKEVVKEDAPDMGRDEQAPMQGRHESKADKEGEGQGAEEGLAGAMRVGEGGAPQAKEEEEEGEGLVEALPAREAYEGVVDPRHVRTPAGGKGEKEGGRDKGRKQELSQVGTLSPVLVHFPPTLLPLSSSLLSSLPPFLPLSAYQIKSAIPTKSMRNKNLNALSCHRN
jgi:hypothetical protein